MSEEKLIGHVVSRLEPQILDYVEVRHPKNTANLLQIVDKYEELFMNRQIRALWDTGAKKSFILEEVYRKYFSYRPRQKTKDRVVTAQGAPCSDLGRVELQIRIREFQKPWEFHILDNMQYQCILGIDFIKASRLTLDFDQKSLIIPDNQIKQLPKIEKPVDIDLTDTKLGDGQQRQLKALFNNFIRDYFPIIRG
ncbi:uncharacterized protein TNCV_4341841 [Trichonephila clavipes]|nr:uncharacterized protein TNCV_4341841 [Trichonephila clavipes]